MSLQDDLRYFPQPDVPEYGNLNRNFGREQLYAGYLPRSAEVDAANAAAGAKTATSGKYTFDPATGQYTWIPAGALTNTTPTAGMRDMGSHGDGNGRSAGGGGYSAASPLSGADNGSFGYQALSAYGQLAPFAPLSSLAKLAAEKMQAKEMAAALARNDQAMKDAIAGYAEGSMFGAPASNPASFAGGNYGLPGSMTSATGAGIAANPMGRDPSQAQAGMGIGFGGFAGADGVGRSAPGSAHGDSAGGDSGGPSGGSAAGAGARGGMGFGGTGSGVGGDSGGGGGSRGDSGGFGGRAGPGFAQGGLGDLGGYSDGGRLLRGPGDGVSDSIPANIGGKRPARLADGEFVVPARIVSELGNGSTEAGARKLYAMLDRIQAGRKKSIGKGKVATNSRADKHLPA